MFSKGSLVSALLAAGASAQKVGTLTTENHPSMPIQSCAAGGSCTTLQTKVVLDANWRWLHTTSGSTNCYNGNAWDTSLCPNGVTCANNCALEGADYSGTYGVTASGGSLKLGFVTQGAFSKNIGSRLYLMSSDTEYYMFKLLNKEFTFDVDVSQLPCGLNGALYFVEMEKDGGLAKWSGNQAGAKYGTGYCDTQCPHDIKFINGEANVEGWTGSPSDPNAGTGKYGSCCHEMDIWEANSISSAFTPHVCSVNGPTRCEGTACGDGDNRYGGICDKDGCDFNPYRLGDRSFYGKGLTVDTSKKITVVTQFITNTGTDSGTLSEIRRVYVQDGRVIQNAVTKVPGVATTNAISDKFCEEEKTVFGDNNHFKQLGGMSAMGGAIGRGMVLAMSIWDDHAAHMLWLDSTYPTDAPASQLGAARGTCPITSGVPADVERDYPNASVTYSNIKIGPIGSTFNGGTQPPVSSSTSTRASSTLTTSTRTSSVPATTPSSPAGNVGKWQQCGGQNYNGPTNCIDSVCTVINPFYHQCL